MWKARGNRWCPPTERPLRPPRQRRACHARAREDHRLQRPVFWYGDILVVQKGNPPALSTWTAWPGRPSARARRPLHGLAESPDDLRSLQVYKTIRRPLPTSSRAASTPMSRATPTTLVSCRRTRAFRSKREGYVPHSELSDWTRFGIPPGRRDMNNVFSRAIGEMFIDGRLSASLEVRARPA